MLSADMLRMGNASLEEALRIPCRYPKCLHFEYNDENMERHYENKHKKQLAEERWRAMKQAGAFDDLVVPKLGVDIVQNTDILEEGERLDKS